MVFQKKSLMSIPNGAQLSGEIRYQGEVNFSGEMHGDGEIQGHMLIAHDAKWQGNIRASKLTVDGCITGNITVFEHLVIGEYAVIKGNITAPTICIQRGASVNGKLTMGQQPVALLEAKKSLELETSLNQSVNAS